MDAGHSTQDPGTVLVDGGARADGASAPEGRPGSAGTPRRGGDPVAGTAPTAAAIRGGFHESAERPAKACAGRKKDGTPCGIIATAQGQDGLHWCRFHRDRPAGGGRLRPPVRALRTMDDCARLCSWAAVRVAEGSLSQSSALAIKALVGEWRQSYADGGTVAKYLKIVALAAAVQDDPTIAAAIRRSDNPAVRAAVRALAGNPDA